MNKLEKDHGSDSDYHMKILKSNDNKTAERGTSRNKSDYREPPYRRLRGNCNSPHILNRANEIYCREHPDAHVIEDYTAGDMICSQCGLVLADRVIDVSSEWRTFSNNDGSSKADPSRVGSAENPLLSEDLSTMIGSSSSDFGGTKYSNRKNVNSSDRALKAAFQIISTMGEKLNAQQRVISKANEVFKKIYEANQTKGRSHSAFAAACLYVAFRQEKAPRSFKEICAVSSNSTTEIKRCFTKLIKTVVDKPLEAVNNQDYLPRFCGNLGLPREILQAATHIAAEANKLDQFASRTPITIAAASIFMAIQGTSHQISETKIPEVSGVAESTIREVFKEMEIYRTHLLAKKS